MTTIDLCEIPSSAPAAGTQFEFFARDFLAAMGFEVLDGPDQGQDDGRDLLVAEELAGSITRQRKIWLVTVKHFAHSGRAVGRGDEPDPEGRLSQFDASGFMCFYSTWPSAPLQRRLNTVARRANVFVYDGARIAAALIGEPTLDGVFRRYFPKSYTELHKATVESGLRIETEIGYSFPSDQTISLDLAEVLERDEGGAVRVKDQELEDVMTACVLADSLRRNRFEALAHFASFRPVVWRYLSHFLETKGLDGKAISVAIDETKNSPTLRLLISIAGAARVEEAADAICRKLISSGQYHSKRMAIWPVQVTPFYDVAKIALANLPLRTLPTIEHFRNEAKNLKRWQAKQALEWAAHQLQRRKEMGQKDPPHNKSLADGRQPPLRSGRRR